MGEQCPEPAPCAPGTYSGDGKNGVGDKACAGTMCAAGKIGPPGATSLSAATCTDCKPGEYSTDAGASIVFSLCMCYVTLDS